MRLLVKDIREDPELQLRDGLDMERVKAMNEFEEQGGHLPSITVVGNDNLLADGHHRLEAARRSGKVDIDADRIPGGKPEAIAAALQLNDIATTLPLTRPQRNKGIKMLLQRGWTQQQIAKVTGVERSTIQDIATATRMRGGSIATNGPKAHAKPVAVLPPEVHEKLGDTVLNRIAALPIEQQPEFAAAVAAANLPEPRVREAIRDLRAGGITPTEAVVGATSQTREMPKTLPEVAKQVRRRLERFLDEPMTVEGVDRDFWTVLEVLSANAALIPLEARGLATLLADVSVRADAFSSRLRTADLIEATA